MPFMVIEAMPLLGPYSLVCHEQTQKEIASRAQAYIVENNLIIKEYWGRNAVQDLNI